MLIPRIIPCLQISRGAMLKTVKFNKRTYLGDPMNVVNLFNKFEVDEIVLLDIDASTSGVAPDFELLEQLADECWVPLTYGGGIRSLKDVEKLINLGVEKVVVGTKAFEDIGFITSIAKEFGTQSVVGSIDTKKNFFGGYSSYVQSGKKKISFSPEQRAKQFEDAGSGEILLQSIDRDGMMGGYDLDMIKSVTAVTNLPVVACGGAGDRKQIIDPIKCSNASASAAGSVYVFSGKERGVLINFPERDYLESCFKSVS